VPLVFASYYDGGKLVNRQKYFSISELALRWVDLLNATGVWRGRRLPVSEAKILVIEDNPLNIELVSDLLDANGFRVYSAQSAEEGIRLARELLPDLVLMDVSLPGMDGITAARALKADPATRSLKVVGLTAHAMRDEETTALNKYFDGYLSKPFDTRTFIGTINSFVGTGK
jgi:two-component system, cell cycle response regulator DivK